jgi:transcriptional regulator
MTLYVPSAFASSDLDVLARLVREAPLATVVSLPTATEPEPFVSPAPLVVTRGAGGRLGLEGHLARRNPHAARLAATPDVLVLIHGPQAYVSPTWYAACDVPTWNYAVAHVRTRATLVEDARELTALLARMTAVFEGGRAAPWRFGLPSDLATPEALTSAIVGFRLALPDAGAPLDADASDAGAEPRVTLKLKLSQNRSAEDRAGVVAGLLADGGDAAAAVARWMAPTVK